MNVTFQENKQTSFTLFVIFVVKSLGIEVLNDGTVTAIFHDPWFFGKSKLNQSCSTQSKIS